jgi:hypothetical protein
VEESASWCFSAENEVLLVIWTDFEVPRKADLKDMRSAVAAICEKKSRQLVQKSKKHFAKVSGTRIGLR